MILDIINILINVNVVWSFFNLSFDYDSCWNNTTCHDQYIVFKHDFQYKPHVYVLQEPKETQIIVGSVNLDYDIPGTAFGIKLRTLFVTSARSHADSFRPDWRR